MTTIAIMGGTGPQGRGLATRWAAAGMDVVLGSRDAERAASVATEPNVSGAGNREAADAAEVVVLAVPWDGHEAVCREIADVVVGKIVIDSVNPLGFDQRGPYPLDIPDGSAAQQAARLLPGARVVSAFHHVSAVKLLDPTVERLDMDILVLGEDRADVATVIDLVAAIPGMRGLYGGRLRNAGQVEALTANLIAINRRYGAHAGVRITDV